MNNLGVNTLYHNRLRIKRYRLLNVPELLTSNRTHKQMNF
jgi:hypothetical protein